MEWSFVDGYGPEALAFLRADPVLHTVLLGVLAEAAVPDSTWAELRADTGDVVGAAWRTPPWGLGVTALPAAAARELGELVAAAAAAGRPGLRDLPTVLGPRDSAVLVAQTFAERTGATVTPGLVETLYRIDTPEAIVADARDRPSGRPRRATTDDLPLLTDWWVAFVDEAGTVAPPDPAARVRRAIADGSLYVWDDGAPRAMVGGRHTGGGVARIGPVYTPPRDRGLGMATALTEHVVRALFTDGAAVVTLYADDANPTSSGIYRRLGFRGVLAWADLRLVRARSFRG
ncbi:MAG: GNAT family N-acetyltransferase [Mycobacteriales bacterium]